MTNNYSICVLLNVCEPCICAHSLALIMNILKEGENILKWEKIFTDSFIDIHHSSSTVHYPATENSPQEMSSI